MNTSSDLESREADVILYSLKYSAVWLFLKRSGKYATLSKFYSSSIVSENDLTLQDQKFLQNLLVHLFLISTLLQTLPSMFLIVGAGTGNTNPNLRPRHHLDNWSEYFPNIIWIKKKQIKNTNIYIHFKFHSKQRIDSGFFLFKAEQKKIEIISKDCKNWWNRWTMILFRQLCYFFAFILRVWPILFHMVSVMSYTHIVRNKLCQASYTNRTGRMQFFTKISGNLLSIDHEKQTK